MLSKVDTLLIGCLDADGTLTGEKRQFENFTGESELGYGFGGLERDFDHNFLGEEKYSMSGSNPFVLGLHPMGFLGASSLYRTLPRGTREDQQVSKQFNPPPGADAGRDGYPAVITVHVSLCLSITHCPLGVRPKKKR